MIGLVSVRCTFHEGLRPVPEANSRPFLIRRYARAARPDMFDSRNVPHPIKCIDPSNGSILYTFDLLRPKPGFGYVISWMGLDWQPGKVQPYRNYTKVAKEEW
jgi:hypothetical protein